MNNPILLMQLLKGPCGSNKTSCPSCQVGCSRQTPILDFLARRFGRHVTVMVGKHGIKGRRFLHHTSDRRPRAATSSAANAGKRSWNGLPAPHLI